MKKAPVHFLFFLLLIIDFTFSFLQYYHTPIMGDIIGGVLPDEDVRQVLDDPFGFKMILSGKNHINPNRFFSHFFQFEYMRNVPLWLQKFVDPISSVYLSNAILKISLQICFILLLVVFISGKKIFTRDSLLIAVIIDPLFQVFGYWSSMGIIDQSIAYTFFYALPLILLMAFFLPFFQLLIRNRNIKTHTLLFLAPLMVILPFSSPLAPGIIVIISLLILLKFVLKSKSLFKLEELIKAVKKIPNQLYFLVPIVILSFYSLFLGRYDINYSQHRLPLFERYLKLPLGIYHQLSNSFGFLLLLIVCVLNVYLINKKHKNGRGLEIINNFKWIGLFSMLYIFLLPLGGYRPYRSDLIRYDTIMPITIALIYIFGISIWFLMSVLKGRNKLIFIIGVVSVLSVYVAVDAEGLKRNTKERNALNILTNSKEKIVCLPDDCNILSWERIYDYKKSEPYARLLYLWQITKEEKLFYQSSDMNME